jgi:hypothetical protein
LQKIQSKYDGKILSASGHMHLSTIYAIVSSERNRLDPIFEDKVEITTDTQTGKDKTQIWFRLKSEDGYYEAELTSIVQIDGLSLA